MKNRAFFILCTTIVLSLFLAGCAQNQSGRKMKVNDKEYLEMPGLSVLAFHDYYPTGSQGGIEIIQHGERIASNGFIRIPAVNGKRIPDPVGAVREIDKVNNVIKSVVNYKELGFSYAIRIWPDFSLIRGLESYLSWLNYAEKSEVLAHWATIFESTAYPKCNLFVMRNMSPKHYDIITEFIRNLKNE